MFTLLFSITAVANIVQCQVVSRLLGSSSMYPIPAADTPITPISDSDSNWKLSQIQLFSRHGTRYTYICLTAT